MCKAGGEHVPGPVTIIDCINYTINYTHHIIIARRWRSGRAGEGETRISRYIFQPCHTTGNGYMAIINYINYIIDYINYKINYTYEEPPLQLLYI